MNKKISVVLAIILMLLCIAATFMVTFVLQKNRYDKKLLEVMSEQDTGAEIPADTGTTDPQDGQNQQEWTDSAAGDSDFLKKLFLKLRVIDELYRENFVWDIDDEVLTERILDAYVEGAGDTFGGYYTAEEFKELMDDYNAEFSGIGVNVIFNPDYGLIEILNVLPDSPALEAGIKPGDLIYTVGEGEDLEYVEDLGYYTTISKLRGPEGSEAVFSVLRGKDYSEKVDFRIIRRKVEEITVMYHVYEPDKTVGVIRITGFDAKTPAQFNEALDSLKKAGCDKYVFDLRYNPGGELNSICTVLDTLLPYGPVVRIMDKDGNQVDAYYSDRNEIDAPMAILVNGSTASAAELFTSAMRDYEKGKVVGTTTFGKGCMQTTMQLSDGSALMITTRMYNPPFSDNYHGIGIVPDVEIELDEELLDISFYKITDEQDNQLAAAVATLYE